MGTTWDETTLTWSKQPAVASPDPVAPDITVANAIGAYYEFDITQFLRAERNDNQSVVSFRLINLTPTGSSGAFYTLINSREADANQPQLVITR